MEAVVKSLDPGSNSDREAVLDTATEVIALVVQTYASSVTLFEVAFQCIPTDIRRLTSTAEAYD